jgi:hypothetical protein
MAATALTPAGVIGATMVLGSILSIIEKKKAGMTFDPPSRL